MRKKHIKNGIVGLVGGVSLIILAEVSNRFLASADAILADAGQGFWIAKIILIAGGVLVAFALVCFALAVSRSD